MSGRSPDGSEASGFDFTVERDESEEEKAVGLCSVTTSTVKSSNKVNLKICSSLQ